MTQQSDWLPNDYEKPASASKYYKFKVGDNKFRILSKPLTGWVDWSEDRKPIRTPEQPKQLTDPTKPSKHFWAFVIWDYDEKNIKVLEITQRGIQDDIYALHTSPEWGNPTNYDINVKRTGEQMETKYNVVPSPPSKASSEIIVAYNALKIDLTKLFTGEDPFMGEDKNNNESQNQKDDIKMDDIPF